jgi:hypothetical protein
MAAANHQETTKPPRRMPSTSEGNRVIRDEDADAAARVTVIDRSARPAPSRPRTKFKEIPQRIGGGLGASGACELLYPHRGRVQELADHAAHNAGEFGAHCGIKSW